MQVVSYDTPLSYVIKHCSLPELVKLFQGSHPAFLAAVVKAHTRQLPIQ